MYTVEVKPKAEKFVEAQIPKIQRQLIKRMGDLATDPRPRNCILLHTKEKLYRIDSGDYRIVYQIQDDKRLVIVAKVRHRKDVYRRLGN